MLNINEVHTISFAKKLLECLYIKLYIGVIPFQCKIKSNAFVYL